MAYLLHSIGWQRLSSGISDADMDVRRGLHQMG